MPVDFTTPSGLIPKGSAFWGSVVFAKQGGALGQGSEEGRDTSIAPWGTVPAIKGERGDMIGL